MGLYRKATEADLVTRDIQEAPIRKVPVKRKVKPVKPPKGAKRRASPKR